MKINFQKINTKEVEIEDRVSHAFSLLFEAVIKKIAEEETFSTAVGKSACLNQRVSHNGR